MRDTPETLHFHYLLWEDWRNGMYARLQRDHTIGDCVTLLSSPAFGEALGEVIQQWPVATAQNLSNVYKNHQPWCGRAACSYEFGATISEVNEAWKLLSFEQRLKANEIADQYTYLWRTSKMRGQMSWPV